MSIDEKKAALTAVGYVFEEHDDWYWFIEVTAPDEWQYQIQPLRPVNAPVDKYYAEAMNELIDTAYAHWQREQELVALRRLWLVASMFIWNKQFAQKQFDIVPMLDASRETVNDYLTSLGLPITDTDTDLTHEDVADLRHNRLDSLYADDNESSET